MRPGPHLHCPDQILIDDCLLVEQRQKIWKVTADELGFVPRGGVECRHGESSDRLEVWS